MSYIIDHIREAFTDLAFGGTINGMNKDEILKQLAKMLESFEFVYWGEFKTEINDLMEHYSGCETDIFSELLTQFKNTQKFGKRINEIGKNEILKNSDSVYSIHIAKGKKFNIRVLMKFDDNKPVFLVAFNEDSGKKNKKRHSGYDRYKTMAQDRFDNYKEDKGEKNEQER